MSVNGVVTQTSYCENAQYAYGSKKPNCAEENKTVAEVKDEYVKSKKTEGDSTKQIYTKDSSVVDRLKQDAQNRKQQLIHLVQKTLSKQGTTYNTLSDMFKAIKNGSLQVDPSAVEQAKKDVAEDGYWGVKQTSDRLVEFAKALSGGDASKAEEMIAAVEKGFKQATAAWGDKLPGICKDTLEATREKLTEWKEELNKTEKAEA